MYNFLIPSCIKNEIHEKQLERCISSIRYFHDKNIIYIINDSDNDKDEIYKKISEKYENLIVIKSLHRGAGETLCFKFILENERNGCDDNYFILHDSMLLNIPLVNIELIEDINFLWHFTNHIIHWDNIIEEQTEYNINNNIKIHTDLLKHHINVDYSFNETFRDFSIDLLDNKSKWCGCMGFCCITNKKTLKYMNDKIPFIEIFLKLSNRNRRTRVVNESIFSIICHFLYQNMNFKNSYDGLYYDGIKCNNYTGTQCGFDNLQYVARNPYISKISFSR